MSMADKLPKIKDEEREGRVDKSLIFHIFSKPFNPSLATYLPCLDLW